MTPHLELTSFPCLLLLFAVALEAARVLLQRGFSSRPLFMAIVWAVRPWGLWAIFSIVYRLFWDIGRKYRPTFPFYFIPWVHDETWSQGFARLVSSPAFWGWSGVLVVLAVAFLLVCRRLWGGANTRWHVGLTLALLLGFGVMLPLTYETLPKGAEAPLDAKGSFMYVWFKSGSTMLYCLPQVIDSGDYLRRFREIQPRLKTSIHGMSHPPGASLALYWLGKVTGATKNLYKDRVRYGVGMTLFAALGVLSVFYLAWTLWDSTRLGLVAAALWAVSPTALAHNPFAPDGVYHVFFILGLALIWEVGTAPRRQYIRLLLLGAVFFALTMLTFSWSVLFAMFGLFLLLQAWRERWQWRELFWRGALPAGTMIFLLVSTCVYFRLDYLAIYRFAYDYVKDSNLMGWPYQWTTALIGSQLDLYLTIGSLVCYLFWRQFGRSVRGGEMTNQVLFTSVVLGVYLFTIIAGPTGVMVETSRVWAWIAAVPVAMAAKYLVDLPQGRTIFLAAVAFAMLQYYAMRLFLFAMA